MNQREQLATFRRQLRQSRQEAVGIALEGICNYEVERLKNLLVDAEAEHVPELQGEARAMRKLLKYLTEPESLPTTAV